MPKKTFFVWNSSQSIVKAHHMCILISLWPILTIKNLVPCNYSICNGMWLFVICNYVLSFLELITIPLILILFFWSWCNYKIAHLSILINFLGFSFNNKPLCSFTCKINYNLVTFYGAFIQLLYICYCGLH